MRLRKIFLNVFIGIFVMFFVLFLIKWFSHGEDYVFHFKQEFELLTNVTNPIMQETISSFQSIAVSKNFFDGVFNVVKTIGLAIVLPFRVAGVFIKWLLF